MKRKYLYALTLLLALSTVAFSNERARFRCRTSGNMSRAATPSEDSTSGSENHVFLHTFIRLLYI
ncbi:MAG TPA: hypothetical protein VFE32_16065 [Puia sp.]|jgi:hypothetical protein|nr:hypothetical protein [Puia sp.]